MRTEKPIKARASFRVIKPTSKEAYIDDVCRILGFLYSLSLNHIWDKSSTCLPLSGQPPSALKADVIDGSPSLGVGSR